MVTEGSSLLYFLPNFTVMCAHIHDESLQREFVKYLQLLEVLTSYTSVLKMVENEFGKRGKTKSLYNLCTIQGLLKCRITDKEMVLCLETMCPFKNFTFH